MGKKSRDKGIRFERDICRRLQPLDPGACRNLDQYQKSSGRDITGNDSVCYQLKWYSKITTGTIRTALAEATNALDEHYEIPAAVTKADGEEPMITFHFDDYISLRSRLEDGEL